MQCLVATSFGGWIQLNFSMNNSFFNWCKCSCDPGIKTKNYITMFQYTSYVTVLYHLWKDYNWLIWTLPIGLRRSTELRQWRQTQNRYFFVNSATDTDVLWLLRPLVFFLQRCTFLLGSKMAVRRLQCCLKHPNETKSGFSLIFRDITHSILLFICVLYVL